MNDYSRATLITPLYEYRWKRIVPDIGEPFYRAYLRTMSGRVVCECIHKHKCPRRRFPFAPEEEERVPADLCGLRLSMLVNFNKPWVRGEWEKVRG